jgi:DNA polymerase III subunit delta'
LNKDKKLFLFTFGGSLILNCLYSSIAMLFKDIAGQENIKTRLVSTVQDDRLSHAWLFFGPEGSGVLPVALAMAGYILCTDRHDGDACGVCAACRKAGKYIHPDLHFVFPVNKGSVDKDTVISDDYLPVWRNFLLSTPYGKLTQWYDDMDLENKQGLISTEDSLRLSSKLSLKAFESDNKVAVIWYPEKMNDQAANKLLKLLEEPPANTFFLLAAENPDQLLTTIRSRCVQVKIPRIADEELRTVLVERHGLTPIKATEIARLAAGNYRLACEMLTEEEDDGTNFNRFRDMMRVCWSKSIPDMIRMSEEMAAMTREKQKSFLEYGLRIVRESLARHFNEPALVYLSGAEEDFNTKFSPFITGANVEQVIAELSSAISDVERNGNGRIIFLDMILKLAGLIKR